MKNFKNVLTIALFLLGATLFAQTKLTGKVVDENNIALPGADVVIKGTTNGTNTDFDGKFSLECKHSTGVVVVSFMGYDSKKVEFNGSKDLGTISLAPSANTLDEIVIVGVADIAKERETPVAVSNIKAAEIVDKMGTKEFPEILNSTPSVYATKQGGGFGDSRIYVRGFDSENTAVMINGVPVNDMENGKVYWSNWAGLTDVASSVQVQRGLGSSKLAISSVGGTINVLTKTSQARQGGFVSGTYGGEGYYKGAVGYSTGLLENNFSASVLYNHWEGDTYADGTHGIGNTWFIGLGYKINDNHDIMLTSTGAPQWHNNRYYQQTIKTYQQYSDDADKPNRRYNSTWGILKGEELNQNRNFYHKPVASLNWDWKIGETASLSTALYGSTGRGGGARMSSASVTRDADGLILWDPIVAANATSTNPKVQLSSMNSHDWYGVISNLNKSLNDNLTFDFGIDVRRYKAYHYNILIDLLGASQITSTSDVNNPSRVLTTTYEASPDINPFVNIKNQEKVSYFNNGLSDWYGAFGQLEYKNETISAFAQGGYSTQSFQSEDFFKYTVASGKQISDKKFINGGNVKGGLNFNINDKHNVFVNGGYYSKQPKFTSVFQPSSTDFRLGLRNETVIGVELGYGLRTSNASLNLNVYRTSWKDRFNRSGLITDTDVNATQYSYDYVGIQQLHKGIEFDVTFRPVDKLKLYGMASIGDWIYQGDATGTATNNTTGEPYTPVGGVNTKTIKLDGAKVGNSAQFTSKISADWNAFKNFNFSIGQFFAGNLYSDINATANTNLNQSIEILKLPSYSLTDVSMSYKYKFTDKMGATLRFNVENLFDQYYISESRTNIAVGSDSSPATWNGVDTDNQVFFGFGRTWSTSLTFNF